MKRKQYFGEYQKTVVHFAFRQNIIALENKDYRVLGLFTFVSFIILVILSWR